MLSATFFGHRDFDYSPYRDRVRAIITDLVEVHGLPTYFDESLYLLEKRVPPQYAISHTNREMILRADFVISGVCYHYGGAYAACKFAGQKKKTILDIFE